jgi:hypothetical protein
MALKIMPHGRLQEWVAEEKGYFTAEGLEYSFVLSEDYGVHRPRRDEGGQIRTGAFETFGAGRDGADGDRYLSALRRAQLEIDLHPELCKHYHLRAVPEKYRDQVDVRAFGTGERIVFLPYTREVFAATQHWTETHHLFSEQPASLLGYDEAALV